MTTNKPEELAWTWMYRKIRRVTTDYSRALCLSEPPYSIKIEPLIRLSDYEALQAEGEELKRALAESRANDLAAMGYLSQIRQLVGGDDFPDMVRRCETLHKAIRRLCNIYAVDDYYSGDLREERLNRAVERAIDAAMRRDNP